MVPVMPFFFDAMPVSRTRTPLSRGTEALTCEATTGASAAGRPLVCRADAPSASGVGSRSSPLAASSPLAMSGQPPSGCTSVAASGKAAEPFGNRAWLLLALAPSLMAPLHASSPGLQPPPDPAPAVKRRMPSRVTMSKKELAYHSGVSMHPAVTVSTFIASAMPKRASGAWFKKSAEAKAFHLIPMLPTAPHIRVTESHSICPLRS
mmetsp:Transcript_81870/g.175403  ORF Transcript_81870/g.175403 Transcript_81870/m.175403 type:complete len:207 (+) Transcript_81870:149-769(+)